MDRLDEMDTVKRENEILKNENKLLKEKTNNYEKEIGYLKLELENITKLKEDYEYLLNRNGMKQIFPQNTNFEDRGNFSIAPTRPYTSKLEDEEIRMPKEEEDDDFENFDKDLQDLLNRSIYAVNQTDNMMDEISKLF
jgi:hypothetical protein